MEYSTLRTETIDAAITALDTYAEQLWQESRSASPEDKKEAAERYHTVINLVSYMRQHKKPLPAWFKPEHIQHVEALGDNGLIRRGAEAAEAAEIVGRIPADARDCQVTLTEALKAVPDDEGGPWGEEYAEGVAALAFKYGGSALGFAAAIADGLGIEEGDLD